MKRTIAFFLVTFLIAGTTSRANTFQLGTATLLMGPSASSNSVALTVTPEDGDWTAIANSAWLHLSTGFQGGTGSTNVVFVIDANPGPTRSGTLTIAGLELNVTQAGSTYVSARPLITLVSSKNGLLAPTGVTTDSAGNVYFCSAGDHRIQAWFATNNSVLPFPIPGLVSPATVRLDALGNIYFADYYWNYIQEWMIPQTNLIKLVGATLTQPDGVALDTAGNVYIADTGNNAIKKWSTNGTVSSLPISGLNQPDGVALDAAGNLYIADYGNHAIKKRTAASGVVTTLSNSGLGGPSGGALDGSGNVYVADYDRNAIKVWSAAANTNAVTTLVSTNLSNPQDVAVDASGNVYIADYANNAIKELPYSFVDPTPKHEDAAAGKDSLPVVLPPSQNLLPPFAPTSDQSWLTISGTTNGVVYFSFEANSGAIRTASIKLLGQTIPIFQAGPLAPPVISPASGTPLTNGTLISISCANPAEIIYFTSDGSPVSTNSALYVAPIHFSGPGPFIVQALCILPGYPTTISNSATYVSPQAAAPVFHPAGGYVTNGTPVTISCDTPGATIYYTLNGTAPSTNSAIYQNQVHVSGGTFLRAFAAGPGYLDSAMSITLYYQSKMDPPKMAPGQGPLTNGTLISLTTSNAPSNIYYTLDGSLPTTNSAHYTLPLVFTNPITLQAQAFASGFLPSDTVSNFYVLIDRIPNVAVTTVAGGRGSGFSDGVGAAAAFNYPQGICVDARGNLFVSDTGNNCIRKILPTGQVITYAGHGMVYNSLSSSATNAYFSSPNGLWIDKKGNLFVADSLACNRLSRINSDGSFSVVATLTDCGPGSGLQTGQLTHDALGNFYVGYAASVLEVLTNGSVVPLATATNNGPGTLANGIGLALTDTNLYAASGTNVVLLGPGEAYNLLTGLGSVVTDGDSPSAGFVNLTGAAADASGNVYLSDKVWIRKLTPSGRVSTVAGTGVAGNQDGPGYAAQFNGGEPPPISLYASMGICIDTAGNLYVSDTGNHSIRKLSFIGPQLLVNRDTNRISITWPAWAQDFALESSRTLSPEATWQTVTNGITRLPDGNQFLWSGEIGNTNTFYRLRKP